MTDTDRLLQDIRSCYTTMKLGLALAITAASVGALNALVPDLPRALQMIHLPTMFLGMGTLLFGIGRHLHLLHLNALKMGGMLDEG